MIPYLFLVKFKGGDIVLCNGVIEGTEYTLNNVPGMILGMVRPGVYKVSINGMCWMLYEKQLIKQTDVQ